ncbi:MAG: LrgB family protein [Spirochaetes bacterium]|uniref:LrgB family protein n=1 Tax=Candidatus Ornithospirochaeta stercoripullorum TaxID=2840899 RepID=A0A9D9H5P6_9SPIO|nr:LrgB family protein [Candidatus Ornithospirochaeta stercoripullorum]
MKELITASPLFGIAITIISYTLGLKINRRTGKAIFNPLLIAEILIIAVLIIFKIPFSAYNNGGAIINLFLGPMTAMLAYSIYRERMLVRKHIVAIIAGTVAGSIASIISIILLSHLFGINETLSASLIPKSVTTPIAIAVSASLGGIRSLTVTALLLTGVAGNILAPFMIKLFRVKNRVAQGVAIGTASHVVGTSKALEMGEDIGAISSIALSFSGIVTAIIAILVL